MSRKPVAQRLKKIVFPVARYMDYLTWGILLAMMCMTTVDVVLRKFTNSSILGTMELTELMMVITVFCSLAQCEATEGHIKIDLVYKRFGSRVRFIFDVLTQTISALLFGVMAWALYRQAVDMKEWGEVTMDLHLPIYPFVYLASFGSLALALVLGVKTLIVVSGGAKS